MIFSIELEPINVIIGILDYCMIDNNLPLIIVIDLNIVIV